MTFMTPTQAQAITQALISEHGLTGWRMTFDNAKRRAGSCSSARRIISLSRYLMTQRSYEDTQMTITHEIAHAIVGAGHGHDHVWAAQHRALGGNGQRCFAHVDESAPWMGECDHGKQFPRYRAPKVDWTGNVAQYRCRCPRSSVIRWRKTTDAPRPVVIAPAPVVVAVIAPAPPMATAASSVSRPATQDPDAAKRAQWAANKRASRARLAGRA